MSVNVEAEALTILLREHREVEKHLEAARAWIPTLRRDGPAAVDGLLDQLQLFGKAIREDLALHIAHEDRALFPVLGRYIGQQTGPIAVMLMEHRHLEGQERRFEKGLENRDPEALADSAEEIVRVLSEHMMKEERVLFPMAQRTMSAADWEEVLGLIRAGDEAR